MGFAGFLTSPVSCVKSSSEHTQWKDSCPLDCTGQLLKVTTHCPWIVLMSCTSRQTLT